MKRALCALFVVWMTAVAVSAQTPQQRIESAIADLRAAAAAEEKSNPRWKEFGADLTARIADAERDVRAGRLYSAIEFLGRSRIFLDANRSASRAATEGMEGFQSVWARAHAANPDPVKFVATGNSTDPAIVRALSQSAQLRGPVLISAAKSYAEVTSAESGFYYLGEGGANVAWSREVRGFPLPASGTPWQARSLHSELAALQAKVNELFRPPLSQDKHPVFIRLNSTLKFAEELNNAGLYFGALQQYLDATQTFTSLQASAEKLPDIDTLRSAAAETGERLAKARQDPSIALFFVQRAQSLLSVEPPAEANVRTAAAILNGVLPAYEATLKAAPPIAATPAQHVVDITLVRWPYT